MATNSTFKAYYNFRNKHVKSPEHIKRLTTRLANKTKNPDEKKLLKQFIDIVPTNVLNDDGTKAKYEPSISCLLYTSPSPRDATLSRMPSSA